MLPAIAAYFGMSIDELFQMPAETRFEQVESMLDREGHIGQEAFAQAAAFLNQVLLDAPRASGRTRTWPTLTTTGPSTTITWPPSTPSTP